MPPLSPLSVLLIASATGLVSITRSLVGTKSGRTRSLAATLAKKEQKLVFVLHVSGNFEDPRFT